MFIAADYPLLEIFASMAFLCLWFVWIATVVTVLTDVFGRSDLSGWAKAAWTALLIFVPFLGLFGYLLAHGGEMSERAMDRASGSPTASRATDEIAEAKRLLDSGAIDAAEFAQLKGKVLAA